MSKLVYLLTSPVRNSYFTSCKCKQSMLRQSSNRKTVPQKTRHQSLKNKNSKNTIRSTLKIRQEYFYNQNVISVNDCA